MPLVDIEPASLRIRMATAINLNDRYVTHNLHTYHVPLIAAYA